MKKIAFAAFAVIAVLSGCRKSGEKVGRTFEFTAELDGIATKTVLNDHLVNWQSGDAISVFDGVSNNYFEMTQFGVNKSKFRGDNLEEADDYYALYPYQATATLSGSAIVANVPWKQDATAGSFAKGANVQIATAVENHSHFYFKNVCALLKFTIPSTGSPITDITIGNTRAAMSGTADFAVEGYTFTTVDSPTRCVMLEQDYAPGSTYYIAILPGTYTNFYFSFKQDGTIHSKKKTGNMTFERNKIYDLGTISGDVTGKFSIESGTQVYFSQGNLQASWFPWKWNFAADQYDVIGASQVGTSSLVPPVDLFCWSTDNIVSGGEVGGTGNVLWGVTHLDGCNGPGLLNGDDIYFNGSFSDWGGNPDLIAQLGSGWLTVSDNQWGYLFAGRANATSKIGHATVNGMAGVIIVPDDFVDPLTNNGTEAFVPYSVGNHLDPAKNIYGLGGDWEAMEAFGAIFLPCGGAREGLNYTGYGGAYTSSTSGCYDHNPASPSYGNFFDENTHNFNIVISPGTISHIHGGGWDNLDYNYRWFARSVRLVKVAE